MAPVAHLDEIAGLVADLGSQFVAETELPLEPRAASLLLVGPHADGSPAEQVGAVPNRGREGTLALEDEDGLFEDCLCTGFREVSRPSRWGIASQAPRRVCRADLGPNGRASRKTSQDAEGGTDDAHVGGSDGFAKESHCMQPT